MRANSLASSFVSAICLVTLALLGGQPMKEEHLMKLLKDFVALKPREISGFDAHTVVQRVDTKWGVTIVRLLQGLRRKGTGKPGRDPTEIGIWFEVCPSRDVAYEGALGFTTSQRIYPDGAGMPQGSWTGLPIGEKSWATAPGEGPSNLATVARLVVWDDKLALRVDISYPPLDPMARTLIFFPIEQKDLELSELAARLLLTRGNLILLGWQELPKLRLVVNRTALEAKETKKRIALVPVGAVLQRLGGRVERRLGVFTCSWRGKKVTLPIGARMVLVGNWTYHIGGMREKRLKWAEGRVALSLPVLFDGQEVWVEGEGIAKALGIRVQRKGETLALLTQ